MIACPDCEEHLKRIDKLEAELAAEKEAKETLAQLRENLAGRLTAALQTQTDAAINFDARCRELESEATKESGRRDIEMREAVQMLSRLTGEPVCDGCLMGRAGLHIHTAPHGDICENGHATHEECTEACSCVGSGKSRLEIAEKEAPLVTLARNVIEHHFDNDCDGMPGDDLQEALIALRLVYHPVMPVPGCENCEEYGPEHCWHPVPIALRPAEEKKEGNDVLPGM